MNNNLEYWRRFYATKQISKDSRVWRQSEGENAAQRELTTRHNDEMKAISGNISNIIDRMNQTAQEMIEGSRKFREEFGKDFDFSKYLPYGKD